MDQIIERHQKDMSIPMLKSNLLDLTADHREQMGPYLYWLRTKLKAQGARNDLKSKREGFGPWVEANLHITRKTADKWADEWAIAEGLMATKKTSSNSTKSPDGSGDSTSGERPEFFSINISLTPSEQEQWLQAWITLGEEQATRLLFGTLTAAAKAQDGDQKAETFKVELGELQEVGVEYLKGDAR